MSGLVGAAQPVNIVRADDQRNLGFAFESRFVDFNETGSFVVQQLDFRSEFWPRRDCFLGSAGDGILAPTFVDEIDLISGAMSAFGFAGVARDQFGSPIAGATVKLFRTSDDVKQDTVVCDDNGAFTLRTSFYPDQHYIVVHKSGSPDVDGISVNTLIGS